MSCMCGDLCCWSCGPAQGNFKCPICGAWASEACEHFTVDADDNLIENPAFKAEFEAAAQREKEEAEAEAKMWEEEERQTTCVHCNQHYGRHDWEDMTCPTGKNIFKSIAEVKNG